MKRPLRYMVNDKLVEKEVNYIPVRYIIAFAITPFEVLAVLGIVAAMCYYVPYFYVLAWLTEIACVVRIIASDDNPDYKVPWLLFVLIVPIAGFMLYFMFYSRTLQKKFIRRLNDLKRQSYQKDDSPLIESLRRENPAACAQAHMLCKISEAHLFSNTRQTYFPLGEDMFAAMLEDLRAAERFIYMEYFIIEEGKLGVEIGLRRDPEQMYRNHAGNAENQPATAGDLFGGPSIGPDAVRNKTKEQEYRHERDRNQKPVKELSRVVCGRWAEHDRPRGCDLWLHRRERLR